MEIMLVLLHRGRDVAFPEPATVNMAHPDPGDLVGAVPVRFTDFLLVERMTFQTIPQESGAWH
jgi:hypothetical protein